TFQNHTNCPLTDLGGKTCIFSHPVYLFLREFSLQDSRGGSYPPKIQTFMFSGWQKSNDIHGYFGWKIY
ncbi:hypothetical protein C6513_21995, partial [Escherichia coli]|nr:hypothetical protein [Escherichia coli]NYX94267.1 hypothetical protein [Escherichia coli]